MRKHIQKRLLIAIPTFLGITLLVYLLASLAPGSPLEMMFMDSNATAEAMEQMEARLGLDQPFYIQYLRETSAYPTGRVTPCGRIYRSGSVLRC